MRSAPLHLRHATPAHADSSEFYPLLADAHEACERRRTERRRARVLHPARPRSLAGVFGYLLAAERTSGDILTQLPNKPAGQADFGPQDVPCPEHTWACPYDVDVARACIAITVSASYPMLQFVSRACLDDLLVSHGLVAPRTGPVSVAAGGLRGASCGASSCLEGGASLALRPFVMARASPSSLMVTATTPALLPSPPLTRCRCLGSLALACRAAHSLCIVCCSSPSSTWS